MKDDSGGRRFWPVLLSKRVDITAFDAERDQLWAEAVAAFKGGEPWHVTNTKLLGMFEDEQEDRRQNDPWEPVIVRTLSLKPLWVQRGVSVEQILTALEIPVERRTRGEEMRVGAILHKLGWARVRERIGGMRSYTFRKS